MEQTDDRRVVFTLAERRSRGGYVCPDFRCMEHVFKKRAFDRAFRTPVESPTNASELMDLAVQTITDWLEAQAGGEGSEANRTHRQLREKLDALLDSVPAGNTGTEATEASERPWRLVTT
jgi:predicted RNA-binding protein YlxR (DUF448 family)